ncbi:uncharacterized protein FFNC_15623 [Fusarium fujikuroi]|nr:uncharacterized protein FFNC_15623 [Fusarium fujikuroi]
MCITTTGTFVYPNWRVQWSQDTLCAKSRHDRVCARHLSIHHPVQYATVAYDDSCSHPYATEQRLPTLQYRPARPSTPSASYRSGDDKSTRRYTNNPSVNDQTVFGSRRRDHQPGPRNQEPIVQFDNPYHSSPIINRYPGHKTAPPVIGDEHTRPLGQRRVHFEEDLIHHNSRKDGRKSNSANDNRHSGDRERRAGHYKEELKQKADLRPRPRIAVANVKIASRPVALGEQPHGQTSGWQAQEERLRERMQLKRHLTTGG